ncbi:hypothetical protein O0L34_g10078 [Tuta absoluta]|nr:hypothetical protein O0L34_g10078 [Tuta absoluta]
MPGKTTRDVSVDKEAINQSVLAMLKEMRYGASNTKPTNRKKKITLLPGQSVCVDPEEENEDPEIFENMTNSEVDSDLNSEAGEIIREDAIVTADLINEKE